MSNELFSIYAPPVPTRTRTTEGSEEEQPSTLEGIEAGFRIQRDLQGGVQSENLNEAYQAMMARLRENGATDAQFRRRRVVPYEIRGDNGALDYTIDALDHGLVWREYTRQAARNPALAAEFGATREQFERQALRRNGGRDRDQDIASRAGLLPTLIGGVGGAMTDPFVLLTLPVGFSGTLPQIFARTALFNAGFEVLTLPGTDLALEALGEDLTTAQALQQVAFAGAAGGVFGTAIPAVTRGTGAAYRRFTPLDRQVARAMRGAEIDSAAMFDVHAARGVFGDISDLDLVNGVRTLRGGELRPSEQDAATIIERAAEIEGVNPYTGTAGAAAHADNLSEAISRVLNDVPPLDYDARAIAGVAGRSSDELPGGGGAGTAGNVAAPARTGSEAVEIEAFMGRVGGAESTNNPRARPRNRDGSLRSSARGRYQFIEGTFTRYYAREFGVSAAEARRVWNSDRAIDDGVQNRLMAALTRDNAAALRRNGHAVTRGNLYLSHFLGEGGAATLLRAAPDTPVSRLLTADAIRANPEALGGKSASQVIAWAHGRMGGRAASVSPRGQVETGGADSAVAQLREEAFELQQAALAMPDFGTLTAGRFRPDELEFDANLMQFKAGGDAQGVTNRLQDIETWNPVLAGRAIVWEAVDGRRLIADGHQRLGLAQRIAAADPEQRPMIDALVMRERDGWDAESVRTWAALKNIAEGSGTPVDAAKIFRAMGEDAATRYLPPRSALVRDAGGLARLGDDAFGAVVNELVDPGHAAIIGRLIGDPGEQKALVDLLIRLSPRTLGEADAVVRQGLAAGFTRETQEDMFGALDSTVSLMIERARVFDRALAEMRKLRQVFTSASRNAETLDAAGNRIDAAASAKEALDNATAIDIVAKLAWRAGPVKDAIDRAAQRLANGERLADVVRDLVRDIRAIDVAELVRRGAEPDPALARPGTDAADGVVSDGTGRAGNADAAGDASPPVRGYSDEPDLNDGGWPSIAEIEAAGQTGFAMFDTAPLRGFDEPDAPGPTTTVASAEHDLRLLADDPDLPTFRIGEGDDAADVALGDLLDGFSRDASAIEAARKCL